MKPNPVGWFEIYVEDMARARAFYEAVFQGALEQLPMPPAPAGQEEEFAGMEMWAFPWGDGEQGAAGALVCMQGVAPGGGGGTLVYFSCEDCAIEAKRASENGGTVFRDKFAIGEHGFIALVTDTEGNMVGLHSMQ